MQFACIMGMISFEKEIVSLHCAATGVTFSLVHEKSAKEQEEKVIKPAINRTVIFISNYLPCAGISKFTFMMSGTAVLFLPTLKSIRLTLNVPLKVIFLPLVFE